MTTTTKVLAGVGTLTAIAVIYFGFTEKGKQKWASLTGGANGTDASGNSIARPRTADDAAGAVQRGADGTELTPRKPGFGPPFGGSVLDANGLSFKRGAGAEFTGVSSKLKKDSHNQKIEDLKKQGLTTF